VGFSKDGRVAAFIVAVAPYEDAAEFAIKSFRASFDRSGVPVSSVQDRGFGDGSAFKVVLVGGSKVLVAFMYRVHNAAVLVMYTGTSTSEAEALKEAETFARLQESKLWAALAPPTPAPAPSPMPTPPPAIPAPIPTPIPTPAVVAQPVVPPAPMVVADPYCLPGQKPAFAFGFAALKERLGPIMGDPTSCEYGDPKGSGDTLQNTSAGLSFYRKSTNTPTFTTGYEHWAQTDGGLVYWTGDSIDPTPDAQVVEAA
jgi:hypothetical protein